MGDTSLNQKMVRGSIWMIGYKLFERSISVISMIILARLLVPEDFGILVMATVFVAFIELIRAFNFDIALIQNQSATREHYDTAWTFNVIAAIMVSLIVSLCAPFVAMFYNDERLKDVLYVLCISLAISGLENIGTVAFRKELVFHKEFIYMSSKKIVSFVATISFAFYFKSYWALVYGMVASSICAVTISYFVHPYRPKFCLSKRKELFGFSSWLMLNNFLFFINEKFSEIVLGKAAGLSSVGLFTMSKDIANMISTELVMPINRAVLPGYSKLTADIEALRKTYLNTISIISIISIPACLGVAAVAPLLVPVLLGNNWHDAIPLIQVLSAFGLFVSLASNSGLVFLALGEPKIMVILSVTRLVILVPSILFAAHYFQLTGVAWVMTLVAIIMLPVFWILLTKRLGGGAMDYVRILYRPCISVVVMWLSVSAVINLSLANQYANWLGLGIAVVTGALSYTLSILALWAIAGKPDGSEQHMLDGVYKKLGISK